MLAPGHFTSEKVFHSRIADGLTKAESMISSGKGDQKSYFDDTGGGRMTSRYVTANVFKSWFAKEGPADFVSNMTNIKGNIPVLYVAANSDRIPQTKNRKYDFDKTPEHKNSKFIIIESGHLDVPNLADEIVIEWLRNM